MRLCENERRRKAAWAMISRAVGGHPAIAAAIMGITRQQYYNIRRTREWERLRDRNIDLILRYMEQQWWVETFQRNNYKKARKIFELQGILSDMRNRGLIPGN